MGQLIHARQMDGEWRYRIWSTVVDEYVTEEMTEEEAETYTLLEAIESAVYQHKSGWDNRLDRAKRNGTSEFNARRVDPTTEGWEMGREEALASGALDHD